MTECAFGACMKTEREKGQGVCGLRGFCVKLAFCVTLPVFCFLWTTSRFEAATSRSKTTRRSTLQVLPVACVAKRSWRFGWGSAREQLSGEGKRSMGKPLMFAAFSLLHARAPPKKRELSGRYYCQETFLLQSCTRKSDLSILLLVFLFSPCLQDHGFLRSRNFATIATWRNDFSYVLSCFLFFS